MYITKHFISLSIYLFHLKRIVAFMGPQATYMYYDCVSRHPLSLYTYCYSFNIVCYNTVKPIWNDHLNNKIYYLWFIQQHVLMKTEGTNLLLLTISAFWSSFRWPLATQMSSKRQRNVPLSGRYRQVSLYFSLFMLHGVPSLITLS